MILPSGTHLCELAVRGPSSQDTVEDALAIMGFEDVVFDASLTSRTSKDEPEAWGDARRGRLHADPDASRWRFLGRTKVALRAEDVPGVSWLYAHTLGLDPYSASSTEKPDKEARPPTLMHGQAYDLFFASWLKTAGGRKAVEEALVAMRGFVVRKTMCMKSLMRFPDRPGADGSLWVAVAEWRGPDSMLVTTEEPLFFYAATPSRLPMVGSSE